MQKLLIPLLLLLSGLPALAQEILSGKVTDGSGQGLAGANVIAHSAENKSVAYAVTGEDGCFTLKTSAEWDHLSVSFLGFKTATVSSGTFHNGQTICLEEGGFTLRQVAVTAQRITESGDTLTYSVAGFKQAQDRSIADVIGKMPGLEVKDGGRIEYQGKPINNFYIEGMDLMGSQYGLASSNLSADKVKDVQVLENHQRVKSLRGVTFSEQAALNIVLKDEAKSTWTGLADFGLGYAEEGEGLLYDNRLMGMQFGKQFQTLMMYKNNDTGANIGSEVRGLADLGGYKAEDGLLSMMSLGGPDFSRERYTFNDSHLLAGNWLLKLGEDSQLRLQGSGFLDRDRQRSGSSITYLTIDGMPVVTEDWAVTGKRNEIKGEADYTKNGNNTYINSRTRIYADWDSSVGEMTCNSEPLELLVRPYKRVLSEDFSLSHTTAAGNVWQVNSSTGNTWLPGRLLTIDGNTERMGLSLFSTKNDVSWRHRTGRLYWTQKVGFDARHQEIVGHSWGIIRPYVHPGVQVTLGRHRLDGGVKLSYIRQSLDGSHSSFAGVEPSLRWDWKSTPKSEIFVNYRLTANPIDGLRLIGDPLYTDYRHQSIGTGEAGMQYTHSLLGTYSYRNPVSGIFLNLQPMYLHRDGNILYENSIAANTIIQRATEQRYGSDTWQMGGRLSKSFSRPRGVIGLSGAASTSDYCYLSGAEVVRANVNVLSASADYSVRPTSWLSVEGMSGLTGSCRVVEENASSWIRDWSHRLGVNVLPAKGWMVSLDNELYHSSEKDFGVNFFSDLSVGYKAKRWELTCKATNLFGTSEYQRVRVTSTVHSWSMTYLRPRGYLVKFSVDL